MKRPMLVSIAAVMTLLLYVVSFVGIDVHHCDCTGHVCAHIALYLDDIHDSHHDCHQCCHEEECSHESHHHGCCHNNVYRVVISGSSEDNGDLQISAPSLQLPVYSHELATCIPEGIHCRRHVPDSPPPICSHGGNIFILRV